MLGGRSSQYKDMYEKMIEVAKKNLFFRPITGNNEDILLSGETQMRGKTMKNFKPELQHLTCFIGGTVALAAKAFKRPHDIDIARKLTEGCIWAYRNTPTGIMPESFLAIPCDGHVDCTWKPGMRRSHDENKQSHLGESNNEADNQTNIPGFYSITQPGYSLR